jgi:threonine/homoserine/homoserine lactone efflux protein
LTRPPLAGHDPGVPPFDSLGAFAALSLALIVVPGPSVMFVVSRAVSLGRRAAVATVIGNSLGAYVQVVLVAAGLGALVERSVAVFTVVKLVGAAYLVYLGVHAIRHRRALSSVLDGDVAPRASRTLVADGFVVGLANPKTTVFFAAILPQFVARGGAPAGVQMLVLGVVFVAIALVSDTAWGVAAGTARQWFARSPRRLERLGATGGAVIVGLGVRLAVSGRSD